MNEKQIVWLKTMAKTLDSFLNNSKRTERDWEDAAGFIAVVVAVCKGHEDEAREVLWGVTTKWENKQYGRD